MFLLAPNVVSFNFLVFRVITTIYTGAIDPGTLAGNANLGGACGTSMQQVLAASSTVTGIISCSVANGKASLTVLYLVI